MKKETILMIMCLMCACAFSGCTQKKSFDIGNRTAVTEASATDETEEQGDNVEETAAETAAEKDEDLKQVEYGNLLYSGISNADSMDSISVSFILSEDKSNIHDFVISVTGFNGIAKFSGGTVNVEVERLTQTVMGEFPVSYENENQNISVGDSTIESLKFYEDGSADLVFTYCFKQTTPHAYEIPVSGISFKLISETAPESSE